MGGGVIGIKGLNWDKKEDGGGEPKLRLLVEIHSHQ